MLKTRLSDHQTKKLLTTSHLVCSNLYSLHALRFAKNVVLSFLER